MAIERPVRVAVWGLGPHACKRILPALAACSATELIGVTTRNAAAAAREAARFGCRAFSSPEVMLAHADVDAVYVATPIGLHHAQGRQVLLAGKHLWCEKSLTTRRAETDELAALSRRNRRALCEAFMFAYHPQFLRILELATVRRELGALGSIGCRFGMPILEHPGFRHSAELGGGALLDMACYPVSLVLRLTEGEPVVLNKRIRGAAGYEVDLAGHALLEFPSGTLAYLEWGFGPAYVNEVTVWGELGSLRAGLIFSKPDGLAATIERADRKGVAHTETLEPADSFVCMLEVFACAASDEGLQERLRREAEGQARFLEVLAAT